MNFPRFFIDRPIFAIVLSVLLLIAGLLALLRLPLSEYPAVAPPTVTVVAAYPGASPDVIAETVASPSQETLARLGRVDENTLVIGLSAGRPHPLVVRAMKLARHRKAKTVAITDATLSEVAKLANVKLYYSSNSPAYVRSHTALLSMIQALAYGVYARDADQYADRIKAFRLK